MRKLEQAAKSRVDVSDKAKNICKVKGKNNRDLLKKVNFFYLFKGAKAHPGGYWSASSLEEQKPVLAIKFHNLIESLVAHCIPIIFLSFPKFVEDKDYLFRKLEKILIKNSIKKENSDEAYNKIVKKTLIHKF